MAGLREQWRRTAMREIQRHALDLFEQQGFQKVTIEAIAAAAGVSPSSVYRYFGTKEGILISDEFDEMTVAEMASTIDPKDPITSLLTMVRRYESPNPDADGDDPPLAWRSVPFYFSVPSVHAALLASADETSRRIAPLLAKSEAFTEFQARVLASALTFGYLATLEQWFIDGRARPIAEYVEEGMRPLRGLWSKS